MSITGFPSNGPTRVGFAGADVMSGFTAAFGVASALYQRTHTGKGQLVDVAMIDAVTGFLAQQFTEHMMTGRVHEQAQNLSVTRKPTGNLFKTRDGWMVLAVMTDPQFQRLMKQLGREDALRRSAVQGLADAHRQQHGAARDHRGGDEAARLRRSGARSSPRTTCRPAACSRFPRR